MTRVGAIDCGTNSIRLLIADIDPGSRVLTDLLRRMEIVRLGYGVDKTGVIAPEAMSRTLAQAREYATQCVDFGVEKVRFVATSASRDAGNAQEFVDGVRAAFAAFGVAPDVVTGHEEASLSFRGATGDLVAEGIPGPYLMVDIGGGSTEFVKGTGDVEQARSVDVGCVRITERHLRSDPPTPVEIAAAVVDIEAAIHQAADTVGFDGVPTLVGLAGSVTTITAHALRLEKYDAERIHLSQLPADQIIDACTSLLSMTREQRAALPFMHEGRVDVIGAGALVWRTVVQRLQQDIGITTVVTSEHDILDGIALSIA
ncbi:MAG: exopolyphosphatase / guanosine-5-triphosphate,3-diphosphate pyrophosphatase [Actinomycetota bacterium]|jgi:exopolyphosphatase/guanosine-5'-triphosphate,3'-diphosphate pyrophosphatase|nr:exopolyphosphatase / guanosine-5-triphosphate,3-diphosphate pyrophosphatase [Actinomycetota bacterium]